MLGNTEQPRDDSAQDRLFARRLSRGFFALVLATTALIVLGALVRAHEAGLACPDWPLCFGLLVPEMNLKVAFEWSHRVLAGSVSLGLAGLSIAALRHAPTRVSIGRLLALAAPLLGVQILLGALTVWMQLAAWTVTAHLITGNSFALVLLLTAVTLRERAGAPLHRPPVSSAARTWIGVASGVLALQIALGGLVSSRFAGLSCPEWPTCNGGEWFPSWAGNVGLHLLHRIDAYALIAVLIGAAIACRHAPRLWPFTLGVALLAAVQGLVGVANVLLGIPVEITGLHSGLAVGLVMSLALAAREAWLAPHATAPPGEC
jgi:cytochrome c oxidase assembly protein subunit 15